jgi:hypothetical protein
MTEIVRYPRSTRCVLFLCAGDGLDRWLHHLGEIEAWARAQGCDAMEVAGRKGWARVLKGYELVNVMLRKEL